MMIKNYQRKHLRAPLRETFLYSDGFKVKKGQALNISEEGMLVEDFPSIPSVPEIPLLICLPQLPYLKNFTLLKMQTFSKELFGRHVLRAQGKLVRRVGFSQYGLQFLKVSEHDQKFIDEYVSTFSSNLVYLQTLIDSFNTDEETKLRARVLGRILGYGEEEKISHLRARVTQDYKSLQWL